MKALKTVLLGAILVMGISSCGNSEQVANYGSDCNVDGAFGLTTRIDWQEYIGDLSSGYPSAGQFGAEWKAISDVRSYVRGLDVPLLKSEQDTYVGAITDYILAFQRYYQSNGQDLTVNNYIMPYNDAEQDFVRSLWAMCAPLELEDDGISQPPTPSGDTDEATNDPNDPWGVLDNLNCADIGEEVWVGYDDTDKLDADGDGWGCESYGG